MDEDLIAISWKGENNTKGRMEEFRVEDAEMFLQAISKIKAL